MAPMLPSPFAPLIRLLSPAGHQGKLSIFIFHRVLPQPDPLLPSEPDAIMFDWIVRLIARSFTVLTLGEAANALAQGRLPAAAAVITFDDGYADNLTVATPILRRYGISATFFIATAFLDGGRMWNDEVIEASRAAPAGEIDWTEFGLGRHLVSDAASRVHCYSTALKQLKYRPHAERAAMTREIAQRAGLSEHCELMLTSQQLTELKANGMEIGAHTHTHPILENLPDTEAEKEIIEGRSRLESMLDEPVRIFAYPNGVPGRDYSERHPAMLKRLGFDAAVSTAPGYAQTGTDPRQLPRFTPWDKTPTRFCLRCVRNLAGL